MLDDILLGYYDSEMNIYVPRGNTTNEDEEVNLMNYYQKEYSHHILERFNEMSKNTTEGGINTNTSVTFALVCVSHCCFPLHKEKKNVYYDRYKKIKNIA